MDGSHFDTLVKTLATTPLSRASVVRGLVASAAALAGVSLAPEPGTAKNTNEKRVKVCLCDPASCHTTTVKKANRGKVIRRNAPCAAKGKCTGVNPCATQTPSCTPNCEQKICGTNGCGGSCGTCSTAQVCANGRCVAGCPGGQKVCNGNCIPNNQCCTDSDCPVATQDCCGGACVDVQSDVRNCGACGTRCSLNEQCIGGACRCGLGPACDLESTCCDDFCRCNHTIFLDPVACADDFDDCPTGTTPCIAQSNNCGETLHGLLSNRDAMPSGGVVPVRMSPWSNLYSNQRFP